jgi:hypothetical protein
MTTPACRALSSGLTLTTPARPSKTMKPLTPQSTKLFPLLSLRCCFGRAGQSRSVKHLRRWTYVVLAKLPVGALTQSTPTAWRDKTGKSEHCTLPRLPLPVAIRLSPFFSSFSYSTGLFAAPIPYATYLARIAPPTSKSKWDRSGRWAALINVISPPSSSISHIYCCPPLLPTRALSHAFLWTYFLPIPC